MTPFCAVCPVLNDASALQRDSLHCSLLGAYQVQTFSHNRQAIPHSLVMLMDRTADTMSRATTPARLATSLPVTVFHRPYAAHTKPMAVTNHQ